MNSTLSENHQSRNTYLDNIKGFLIICVVVGHFLESSIDYGSDTSKILFLLIYSFHMPLFIFISGILCNHTIESKERLYEKLIMLAGLFIMLKLLIYPFQRLNNPKLEFTFVSTDGVPWYLFAMCVFFIMTYLLRHINKRKILAISLLLALLAGYDNEIGDVLVLSRCLVFFPYFVLGWMCDSDEVEDLVHQPEIKVFSLIVLLVSFFICKTNIDKMYTFRFFFTGRNSYETILAEHEGIGILFRISAYMITIILSVCILSLIPKRHCFLLEGLGHHSLQIYFLHRPVLFVLQYLNTYAYIHRHFTAMANYIWVALALVLVIILAQPVFTIPFRQYQTFIKHKIAKKPD